MKIPKLRHILVASFLALGWGGLSAQAQLVVQSVGSVTKNDGTTQTLQVTVVFSETVDSATATAVGNYTLSTGTVSAAALMTGLPAADAPNNIDNVPPGGRVVDNQCVVLTATGTATGAASLIVKGVKNAAGTATMADQTVNFVHSGYKWAETGTLGTRLPGRVIAVSDEGFDIFSGGSTQWSDNDEVTFVYKEVTGDFELSGRVEHAEFSSRWGRSGIMAREALNIGENDVTQDETASRYAGIHTNPARCYNDVATPMLSPATNTYESHVRAETGGETGSSAGGVPAFPNAWLKTVRTGSNLTSSRSNDGVTFDETPEGGRDFDPDLAPTLFVGVSYSPETGNINAAHLGGVPRNSTLFLYQFRFNAIQTPQPSSLDSFPTGFTFNMRNAQTTIDQRTIALTLDGTAVTPTGVTTAGDIVSIRYEQATPFAQGSAHSVVLTFKDSAGGSSSFTRNFTSTYGLMNAANKVASATGSGFTVSVNQQETPRGPGDANSIINAEDQLAHNTTNLAGTPNPRVLELINMEQDEIDTAGESFTADLNGFPNGPIPGIPGGATEGTDNFVAVIETFLELKAGSTRFGVNSDDGFRATSAAGVGEQINTEVLGFFNGGRGVADTLFDVYVAEAGFYPVRLSYWEGNGGAACEFFSVDLATGEKILVNDRANAKAVKAYTTATSAGSLSALTPYPGKTVADRKTTVRAIFTNGSSSVSDIALVLDGQAVTPTVTNSGSTTTAVYTYPADLDFDSTHSGTLTYKLGGVETTVPLTFKIRLQDPDDLPNAYTIEMEMFDFESGQSTTDGSVQSGKNYLGDEYNELSAVHEIDYFRNSIELSSDLYRLGETPNWPMYSNAGAATLDVLRPGFAVESNFTLGWAGGGQWLNFTRTIPAGNYRSYAAISHGDAIGTPDRLQGTLSLVTAGAGTRTQTTQFLGRFNAPSSGAWGDSNLVKARRPDGKDAIFTLPGGKITLKFTTDNGDIDWFTLVPTTDPVPPDTSVLTITVQPGSSIQISWTPAQGKLQQATSANGPFTDVPGGGTSPVTVTNSGSGSLFFRVVAP